MNWRQWGAKADARIGDATERAMRRMNRRDVVRTAVLGGAASIAAVAVGERPSFAASCDCGPTKRCAGCPATGCPSGYSLCLGSSTSNCFNSQGFRCEWPSGEWVACSGLGRFGHGIEICYDCKGSSGCKGWCTCLSQCICCNCTTAADVVGEQRRLKAALAGA